MSARLHPLRRKVVVITGASAGLGRASAVELAGCGASVVLAARRREDLEQTARLCRRAGGNALVVVTDVTREDDVRRLTEAALAEHGHIDVWINNAGITLFGLLEEAPLEEHRRVIETNLFGAMLCARAVMPHFKARRRGVLINVGSVLSKIGQSFVPSYVISKFGVHGLSEALRAEVADEPDIHVCTIFPYAIDTPHFQSGANYVGLRARAMPPMQSPEKVARAIVDLAARPRREVHVPHAAVLGLALHAALPRTTERLVLHALERWHFDDTPEPMTSGNLHTPTEVNGGQTHGQRKPQLSTARFAGWAALELARIEVDSAARKLRGWMARPRSPRLLRPVRDRAWAMR
jgi:short-subunit dehydrogenase